MCVLLLIACGEEEELASLKQEKNSLQRELDSLKGRMKTLDSLRGIFYKTIDSAAVGAGEGLFQVLSKMNVTEEDRRAIVLALQDSIELSKLRLGEVFYSLKAQDGQIVGFRYASTPANIHLLFRSDSGFSYRRIDKEVERRQSIFEGRLAENSTLDGTLRAVGIPRRMVGIVSSVLQCKVNFRLAQPGDKFRVLLEETFFEDSVWINGKVLYAEFDGKTLGHHEAFLYEEEDPKSSFNAHYTESGEALVFDGLRYPLDRLHITSSYGSRIHPITGQRKVHYGIDYGSPKGSPVYAVAEGNVIVSGYDEYSGNKIAIRHRDNTTSWYMHLSSRGVSVGNHVMARSVIGRVGSTGRSTGPHLHLGFKNERGEWINPQSKTMIATPKLAGERLARLQFQVGVIRKAIDKTLSSEPKKLDSADVFVRSRKVD